jgi:hypothetical protein
MRRSPHDQFFAKEFSQAEMDDEAAVRKWTFGIP